MSASENIQKVFRLLGYDERRNGLRVVPVIFILLSVPLGIGSFMYIVRNKGKYDDTGMTMTKLLRAVKDVDCDITVAAFSMVYMISSESMKNLLQIIDKKYSSYFPDFPEPQKSFLRFSKLAQINDLRETGIMLTVVCFVTVVFPGLAGAYLIIKEGTSNADVSELPLPLIFWFPKKYDTVESYIIIFVLQTVYMSDVYALAYFLFGSVSSAFQSVIIDIRLFCIDLGDIDNVLNDCADKQLSVLRDYTNYLIRCHQQIQRQVKLVSHSVSSVVTLSNQCLCFQICTALYSSAEVQDTTTKIMFCVLSLTVSLILFVYCRNGQEIINASEEMRRCLYNCSWLDKPLWFKKDLQIMMTMANVPMHIKPFGMYILDLNNFSYIMNAAYTYLNILRTLKG